MEKYNVYNIIPRILLIGIFIVLKVYKNLRNDLRNKGIKYLIDKLDHHNKNVKEIPIYRLIIDFINFILK